MSLFRVFLICIWLFGTFLNCRAFENNYFKQKHIIKHNDRPMQSAVSNQEPKIVSPEDTFKLELFKHEFEAKYEEIIAFVGKSKVWILVKANDEKTKLVTVEKSEKQTLQIDPQYQVDDIFINKKDKENFVLIDQSNQIAFMTRDDGEMFDRFNFSFRIDEIYFDFEKNTLFAFEKVDKKAYDCWISVDSGKSWSLLANRLKELPKWNVEVQPQQKLYFVENLKENTTFIEFDLNMYKKEKTSLEKFKKKLKVIKKDAFLVESAVVSNNCLYLLSLDKRSITAYKTKSNQLEPKQHLLILPKSLNMQDNEIQGLDVISDDGIYGVNLLIKYHNMNGSFAILVKSSSNNPFVFNQVILNNIEIDLNMEANLIKLNNKGDVYIANIAEKGSSRTVTSSSQILKVQDADLKLNIHDQFFYLHTANQNKLNNPKFPEFIIANSQSPTFSSLVYISTDKANNWKPILMGNYLYGFVNNGAMIFAVSSNKKTGSLLYSLNYGSIWHKFDFEMKVNVDYIFVEENSQNPTVILFGTDEKSTRTILLRISFNPQNKEEDDVTMKGLKDDFDHDTMKTTSSSLSSKTYNSTSKQIETDAEQFETVDKLISKPEVSDETVKKFVFDEQKKIYIIIYVILGVIFITSIIFTVLLIKLKFRISKNVVYTNINTKSLKKQSKIFLSGVCDKLDLKKGNGLSDDKELLFKEESA